LQKIPAEEFTVTAKMKFNPNPKIENEKAGLLIMGLSYANLSLVNSKEGINLVVGTGKDAVNGTTETERVITEVKDGSVYLRVKVRKGALCNFSYSLDGKKFFETGETFQATPGKWIGAKVGLFCTRATQTNDSGFVDVDWFRFEP
jgi:Beta xylosidase C-terminal Concanavalin A-like domain